MSIQRIEGTTSPGWQARQYTKWPKYISAFFADKLHGKRKARELARQADDELRAEIARTWRPK